MMDVMSAIIEIPSKSENDKYSAWKGLHVYIYK